MKNHTGNHFSSNEKFAVIRSLRKKQFCRAELLPNRSYKPEPKDTRVPVFDTSKADQLRKSLSCKVRMIDGTDTCNFHERFLRSVSTLPPKKPPPTNACKIKGMKRHKTEFRSQYYRDELPLYIATSAGCKRGIAWKMHYGEVNFVKFLPIFFEGIHEKREPLKFLARNGTHMLLEYTNISALVEALPGVAHQIYDLFDTNDKDIICETLKCIQKLVLSNPDVGPELIPYYRYILPGMRVFKTRNKNLGDTFEYGQHRRRNIGDLIDETLEILERYGGDSAFYNMKRIVPLYTSKRQILKTIPAEELARRQGRPLSREQFVSPINSVRPKTK